MKGKQFIGRTQYFSSKYLSIFAHGKRKNLVFRITELQFGDSDFFQFCLFHVAFGTHRLCSLGKELAPCQVFFSEALNGYRKFVLSYPARHRGKLLHGRHLTSLSSESSLLSLGQNKDRQTHRERRRQLMYFLA